MMGFIKTLVVKYLVMSIEDLNYKLVVNLTIDVSLKI